MKFEKVDSEKVWTGKFFDVVVDSIRTDKVLERQYIRTNFEAVVVLPLTTDGNVILVRQYRSPADSVLVEVPAGKTETGEDISLAAARELEEETGCRAGILTYLGKAFASPGISSEMYHFFVATNLERGNPHPDADEDTEPFELSFEEFVKWIFDGRIMDAKTIAVAGLWLMRKR